MSRQVSRAGLGPPRSDCPIACTLDLIGDRWTLLIVRDMFKGKHRFSEFLEAGEGIKTNILTDRLKRLERNGLVTRSRYQANPPRFEYHLTKTGKSLGPVLKAMFAWGRGRTGGRAVGRSGGRAVGKAAGASSRFARLGR